MGFWKEMKDAFNGGREKARKEGEAKRRMRQEARDLRKVGGYSTSRDNDKKKY